MLLAGDVGGTKTTLAVFSPEVGARRPLAEATLPSAQYPSLEALVRDFLEQADLAVDHAIFGVAGPVVGGRGTITNLGWVLDETQFRKTLALSTVKLLNDLQAIGFAVPALQPDDLHTLQEGQSVEHGAVAVIAPGTGLGEAFLTWDGSRYASHPAEGGHTDFAPTDDQQAGLLRYVRERYDHVSYERVCSGMGLPNIYDYLKASGFAQEPRWLAEELKTAQDPTPLIVHSALSTKRSCTLCCATLDMFVGILGAEAGNLALKVLATGGVYLGGGIPPRILPALTDGRFVQSFQAKGRLASFMSRIPVHVILRPKVALLGAATAGLKLHYA